MLMSVVGSGELGPSHCLGALNYMGCGSSYQVQDIVSVFRWVLKRQGPYRLGILTGDSRLSQHSGQDLCPVLRGDLLINHLAIPIDNVVQSTIGLANRPAEPLPDIVTLTTTTTVVEFLENRVVGHAIGAGKSQGVTLH